MRPHCLILKGNFNCRSNQWWSDDKNLPEGIALDDFFESYNITQLIYQPTNIEPRGVSCVDLIVTDQPNLFIDHGIHSSMTRQMLSPPNYSWETQCICPLTSPLQKASLEIFRSQGRRNSMFS